MGKGWLRDACFHLVDEVLAALGGCGNLEEGGLVDAHDVDGLRTAVVGAEHEVHLIGGIVDGVGLLIPVLAIHAHGGGHLVAGPCAVGGCVGAVAAPCPEVHAAPSHGIGVHVDVDVVGLEGAHGVFTGDDTAHAAVLEQSHLQCGGAGSDVDGGAAGHGSARCGGRAAVGGIDEFDPAVLAHGGECSGLLSVILS